MSCCHIFLFENVKFFKNKKRLNFPEMKEYIGRNKCRVYVNLCVWMGVHASTPLRTHTNVRGYVSSGACDQVSFPPRCFSVIKKSKLLIVYHDDIKNLVRPRVKLSEISNTNRYSYTCYWIQPYCSTFDHRRL